MMIGGFPQRYWFGELRDPATVPVGQSQVERTRVSDALHGANTAVMMCPDYTNIVARYSGATSGYAYNYKYCGPGVNPNWAGTNPNALLTPICYRLRDFQAPRTQLPLGRGPPSMTLVRRWVKSPSTFYLKHRRADFRLSLSSSWRDR